jgi:hypothetical protein
MITVVTFIVSLSSAKGPDAEGVLHIVHGCETGITAATANC